MNHDTPDFLRRFQSFLELDRGLAAHSVSAYISDCLQAHQTLQKQGHSLSSATALDLKKYLESLCTQGISARSRARKLSALRLFFQFTRPDDPPTEKIESPQTPRGLPKTLALKEVEDLLAAPDNLRDRLMLRLMYATGIRVTELVTLPVNHVDLESGLIRVCGKGSKVRLVPLDKTTTVMMGEYLKERPTPKAGCREVFLTRQARGFTRQGFWLLVKGYALKAGIFPLPSPHTLRHAFATHLLERGMNLRSLQTLLGHSDISTTEIYSHVSNQHLKDTLQKHHPRSKNNRG